MPSQRPTGLQQLPLMVGDLLLVNGAVAVAYFLRFYMQLGVGYFPVAPLAEYFKAMAFLDGLVLLLFLQTGLYKIGASQTLIGEWNAILKALCAAELLLLAGSFFYREFTYSRLVSLYAWLLAILALGLERYFIRLNLKRKRQRGEGLRKGLMVGSGKMAGIVASRFRQNPSIGYRLIGYATGSEQSVSKELEEVPCLGTMEDFEAILAKASPQEVFIADPGLGHYDLLKVIDLCEGRGIPATLVPSIFDLLIDFTDVSTLDGIPFVSLEENRIPALSMALKRVFDVVFSLAVMILGFPLAFAIVIAIRLDSPGPVVFRQRRAGLNGKPFTMYKFRSMVQGADKMVEQVAPIDSLKEPVFKLKEDPRVTRVGRFLRRWSLDEIPQFTNVLLGQMSVVGPRPEEISLVERYNVWQKRRLKMKPGITGLQQISNRGGDSLEERVNHDIYYMRRYSFLLDIVIVVRTLGVVLLGKGAY